MTGRRIYATRPGPGTRALLAVAAVGLALAMAWVSLGWMLVAGLATDADCGGGPPRPSEMALFPAASAVVGLGWSIVLAVSALATRGRGLRRRWWWLAPTLFVALSIVVLVVAGKVSTEDAHPYDCLPLH